MEHADSFSLLNKYRKPIMGFAALWILFFHEWQPIFLPDSVFAPVENYLQVIGFCGVDIFLMLSGMGLVYSIENNSIGKFYYNRIKRVFFPLLVMALVRKVYEGWSVSETLRNLFGVNFFARNMYSFLWFGTAIIVLYLLFPLYYWIFDKAKNKTEFTLLVITIWLILSILLRDTLRNDLYGFTNRIPIFVIGVLIGYKCKHDTIAITRSTWVLLSAILSLGLYLAWLTGFKSMEILVPVSDCCLPNILIAISLPILLAKLIDLTVKVPLLKVVTKIIAAVLGFYGAFSMELYCVQEWLCARIYERVEYVLSAKKIDLLFLVAVTVAGYVLYWMGRGVFSLMEKIIAALHSKEKVPQ